MRMHDRLAEDKHKMTIAHIMPWAGVGGVEIATLRMTEATRDRFRHVAFCLPEAVAMQQAFSAAGIETVLYDAPEPSLLHGLGYLRSSQKLAAQLRSVSARIVHYSEIKGAYHCSLAAVLAKARTICHVRNTYPQISLRERLTLKPVDHFIFVSEEARRHFGMAVPDKKSRVIYDAIDLSEENVAADRISVRSELGIPAAATVVGMVARVNPQKDYFTLASAAAQVLAQFPETRFLVVGDNSNVDVNRDHYRKVTARLDELGIRSSFLFAGHRNDVPRMIAAMDISILPTHREGFGLCIAESMALRRPVVATAVGGLLEVVQHGETGYLHEHDNSSELASHIIALIANPAEAKRLADAGFEYVRKNFSPGKFVDEISNAYMEAAR